MLFDLHADLLLLVVHNLVPHTHLYAFVASCRYFRDVVRDNSNHILLGQALALFPFLKDTVKHIDSFPHLIAYPERNRRWRHHATLATLYRSVQSLRVYALNPNHMTTLSSLELFSLDACVCTDASSHPRESFESPSVILRATVRFSRTYASVTVLHADFPDDPVVFRTVPFQGGSNASNVVFVMVPDFSTVRDNEDAERATDEYLEDAVQLRRDSNWSTIAKRIGSCVCTSRLATSTYAAAHAQDARALDVWHRVRLSRERLSHEQIVSEPHGSPLLCVRATTLDSQSLGTREAYATLDAFERGFGADTGDGETDALALWDHIENVQARCAMCVTSCIFLSI
jgi:hypothetical protein